VDAWVKSLHIIHYMNTTVDIIILQKSVACVPFYRNDCMPLHSTVDYAQLLPPPDCRLSELLWRFLRATSWTPMECEFEPSRQKETFTYKTSRPAQGLTKHSTSKAAAARSYQLTSIECGGLDCVEIYSTHSYALTFWRVIKYKEKHENLRSR
jgi:hypothetical protein